MTPSVVIVGAGAAGLSCACTLLDQAAARRAALALTVIDAEPAAGGHARTDEIDGYLIERGPNGFLPREPQTLDLVERLGLRSRLIEASPAARRRYVLRHGRLCQVPDGPRSLLTTPVLSWRGKLRLLAEPWAPGPPGREETVYDFAARRIGHEAADVLVDTAVAGISAGDSRHLSVSAQFPMMTEMEREHGGLIRAMLARRAGRPGATGLLSFDRGLGVLTGAMAERIGSALMPSRTVASVQPGPRGWIVHVRDAPPIHADHAVLATSARAAAMLVHGFDARLGATLVETPYSGVAVVALGFRASDLPCPIDGYGYLVARSENLHTLGVLWESTIFDGRAPRGCALLRVFLGGARHPGVATEGATTIVETARRELSSTLGLTAQPQVVQTYRWPDSIAQYTLGHLRRRARIAERLGAHGTLHVCGASYDGVSFNQAVVSGRTAAMAVAQSIFGTSAAATAPRMAAAGT